MVLFCLFLGVVIIVFNLKIKILLDKIQISSQDGFKVLICFYIELFNINIVKIKLDKEKINKLIGRAKNNSLKEKMKFGKFIILKTNVVKKLLKYILLKDFKFDCKIRIRRLL